jgi:hypothetical protein
MGRADAPTALTMTVRLDLDPCGSEIVSFRAGSHDAPVNLLICKRVTTTLYRIPRIVGPRAFEKVIRIYAHWRIARVPNANIF